MSSAIHEAIRLLQSAAALKPEDFSIRQRLLAAMVQAGQFVGAIREFAALVSQRPEMAQFHYETIESAIQQASGFLGLRDAFRNAVDRRETPIISLYGLGLACQVVQDADSAISAYQECIALDPSFALAHYNLANALLGRNQLAEAQTSCEKAIGINPLLAEPHMLLGSIYMRQHQREKSVAEYREFLRLAQPYLSKYASQAAFMIRILTGDLMP